MAFETYIQIRCTKDWIRAVRTYVDQNVGKNVSVQAFIRELVSHSIGKPELADSGQLSARVAQLVGAVKPDRKKGKDP